MKEKIVYKIFLGAVFILRKLPKNIRRRFLKFVAYLGYVFARKTNKIIKTNLRFVFEDKIDNEEIKKIQKYTYFDMVLWGQTLIESIDITNEEIKQDVTIEGEDIIHEMKRQGKPIIFISAHYGNLEMLSSYINRFVVKAHQVARRSNFRQIDEFLTKTRQSCGSTIIFRDGAIKHLVKALNKKEAISLIIDQHIGEREGEEVVLLGKKVYQTSSTASLARKFNAAVIPIAIFNKEEEYKYHIKVYEPLKFEITDDEKKDIKDISQKQADALSQIILEDKKQWFWAHKRFKGFYSEIYK